MGLKAEIICDKKIDGKVIKIGTINRITDLKIEGKI